MWKKSMQCITTAKKQDGLPCKCPSVVSWASARRCTFNLLGGADERSLAQAEDDGPSRVADLLDILILEEGEPPHQIKACEWHRPCSTSSPEQEERNSKETCTSPVMLSRGECGNFHSSTCKAGHGASGETNSSPAVIHTVVGWRDGNIMHRNSASCWLPTRDVQTKLIQNEVWKRAEHAERDGRRSKLCWNQRGSIGQFDSRCTWTCSHLVKMGSGGECRRKLVALDRLIRGCGGRWCEMCGN